MFALSVSDIEFMPASHVSRVGLRWNSSSLLYCTYCRYVDGGISFIDQVKKFTESETD